MSLYKRGNTWWMYVVYNGQRFRHSCKTSDRGRAQAALDNFRHALRHTKQYSGTLYGALDAWSARAGSADQYRVGKLKRLLENRLLGDLRREDIEPRIPASSNGTYNRYVNILSAAITATHGPALELTHRKPPPGRIRWITHDQWERLYRQLPAHLKPIALFSIETGLRQRNATHLRWEQVDLARKLAWVNPSEAKSRKAIGVPLSERAVAVLLGQQGKSEVWVFPYKDDAPLARITSSKETRNRSGAIQSRGGAFQRAVKRAGLVNFTWHDLRHTWASWHVQNGTPLPVLKELGGWASMQMVMRYAHLAPDHLRAYANNAGHKATPQTTASA